MPTKGVSQARKAELRTDAFLAAIGHILPPEFREEVSRIIGYKLICERHNLIIEIALAGNNTVKVTSAVERTIRNKSTYPHKMKNFISADEWGYAAGRSEIIDCVMEIGGEVVGSSEPVVGAYHIQKQTDERTLGSQQIQSFAPNGLNIKA